MLGGGFGAEDLVPCFAPGRNHFKHELTPPLVPPFIGKKTSFERGRGCIHFNIKYYSIARSMSGSVLIDPGF